MKTIVMHYIEPPHIILRKGLCAGTVYPKLAEHMAEFMAATLFSTSRLAMSDTAFRQASAMGANAEMCKITELVIFTEPYGIASNNRHTTPQLDSTVAALREDAEAKVAISELKTKFVEKAEAYLHGDLHTGSMMCTQESTQVIDPEFAYYGPIGFDVGSFLANLLMAYFAQDGHATATDDRSKFRAWLSQCIVDTWQLFATKFLTRWSERAAAGGENSAYPALLFGQVAGGQAALAAAQSALMAEVFRDTLGFCGAEIIRRTVGIAHVEDLESIQDPEVRAACERRAIKLARTLLVLKDKACPDIKAVVVAADAQRQS
uniref:S-methyl-5-thioribose kinase n=2 Tax=Pyramimonas obovata TaxID=1411642 RepID=A0A7S0R8Q8_9CHLO